MIPYGRQDIIQQDISAVQAVLHSDWLTQGPTVPRFEEAIANKMNARFAVAVNSATSALHIACLALDLGPGDWLWTSPNTFVASANCALYCGARVDFVDIDPCTYNMSADMLQQKLEVADHLGKLPKIVIPVHFAGQSCDMVAIHKLSKKYGFKIIEDASHAIGGLYQKNLIGSCKYSDIAIFSFHPVKIITTGEGGMALTNDSQIASRLKVLRSHGITRDTHQMQNGINSAWYYEQQDLGFNYRMTDIQAALGLSQLERLDMFVSRRREIASIYNSELKRLPLVLPFQDHNTDSSWHLYAIQSPYFDRDTLFTRLRQMNIGVNVHYIPVHTQPFYKKMGFMLGDFPEAENYYNNALSIPIYSALQEHEQEIVVSSLSDIFYE